MIENVLWERTCGDYVMKVIKKPDDSILLISTYRTLPFTSRRIAPHIARTLPADSAAWSVIVDCQLEVHRHGKLLGTIRP
jgi:phage tail sheath gpL-like